MYLAITIIILLIWAVYAIIKKITPPAPPIENMEEHLKIIQSLPNQKNKTTILEEYQKKITTTNISYTY